MKLPSAEEFAQYIMDSKDELRDGIVDAIRTYRNATLEAAAEVADKRESDVCKAVAAEIRALIEDL